MISYWNEYELAVMGVQAGDNVKVAKTCRIVHPDKVKLGSHVRIDDFCVLTNRVEIGSHVDIGPQCFLNGYAGLLIRDHVSVASGVKIYSASDDYDGVYPHGNSLGSGYWSPNLGLQVIIGYGCLIGANTVILPGTTMLEGSAVGALSLVKGVLDYNWLYAGSPVKKIRERSRDWAAALVEFHKTGPKESI